MTEKELNTHRSSLTPRKRYEELMISEVTGTTSNEPQQAVVGNQLNEFALREENNSVLERNRALLQYTATLANSNSVKDEFNYEFVESLVKGGADVNTADQHGQTMFHEVVRSWNTDVARFLIKLGCDVNKQDTFGRSPLHVAAAVDHVEMTEFLLLHKADIGAKTYGELQAPIHYAAKNGATRSLKMLLSFNANIDTPDAKQRTPLQVSAEWSRGKAAKLLIDEGAASCLLDITGNSALCALVDHLPNLAVEALNQLHATDVITMCEYYYLQHLEASRQKVETKSMRTVLETAVVNRKYDVVTHPVMQRLVLNKWNQFGRLSTSFELVFHIVFGIAWTAFALVTPERGGDLYADVVVKAWKITVGVLILIMTLYDIGAHVHAPLAVFLSFLHGPFIFCIANILWYSPNLATFKSRRSQRNWIQWKMEQLEYDLKYCHPRWPQEKKFVKNEIKRVHALPLFDAFDAWFYLDWIILLLIVASIVTHFVFFYMDTSAMRYLYTRTISIANLLVWLRLLKYVRPFHGIGTLVLILSDTAEDFLNWAFLFFLIMVPFAASFWINFGPLSVHPAHGYHTTGELLYRVFQIAVGDDFNLEDMVEVDPVMARILVVLYVTAMTIVTLNLLIALLSETFGRVYNNAVANTIMQRAIKVVESERTLSRKRKSHYREYMKMNCSPEVVKMQVVPWNEGRRQKEAETEIASSVMEMKNTLDDRFGKIYGKDKTSDFDCIIKDLKKTCDKQSSMTSSLEEISKMLNIASAKSITASRHVSIKDGHERRSISRHSSHSLKKKESKSFVTTLQDVLPSWFTASNKKPKDERPRGNRRRHRPNSAPPTRNGDARSRRGRRRSRRSHDLEETIPEEISLPGTELRRRSRRKTRKSEPAYVGHRNRGYKGDLAWDNVSIDSASI